VWLLKRHQKIEAIKLVRSIHGTGLKEAKEWVETVERGEPAPSPDISINPPRPGPTVEEVALPLLQRGEKIEAIRAVRELTGLGLADAKNLVEAAPKTLKDLDARLKDTTSEKVDFYLAKKQLA
jgi:ribosomal protein L7/L12